MRIQSRFIAYLIVGIAVIGMTAVYADDEVKVPFVGCPSDGQMGPLAPPTGTAKTIHISFKLPGPIAFYQPEGGEGVFAPTGWHCLGLYGSSGTTVILSAHPLPTSGIPSGSFDAPVIELSTSDSETSGRFEVARLGWMLFPDLTKDFVRDVEAEDEGIVPKSDIEVPKYPEDKLTSLNKTLVQFETPANTKGLGTEGYVNVARAPIAGLVSLDEGNDGMSISVLRISMGAKGDTWTRVLLMLNTPCLTGSRCEDSQQ